jgi:hypothetical protein
MSESDQSEKTVSGKDKNLEFIENIIDQEMNHIVREDDSLKGTFNIEVRSDGRYNIKLYKGTQGSARTIEDVSKAKLMELIEDKL